ncbi:Transposon Ty3-G Gag-Pol polyprotein [Rhizoctonia solani]|uniref:Transposon Ty3-G Gag-Pol polyprotein n=1 Tax=Rhizoctonia solani TaxID=456999 RepID=A0A8H8T346_9AGAM|nr:Transposon Ty3-G Gag-Pol polyprotein [Rhizoctonia solani]QRW26233.1 Transposon Ty3-G Gag-Pol polyprotein [Rhizoctonia solani]
MLTDEEYKRLLEMLRNQERLRTAREYKPSQTSGAGPSGACCTLPVTLEEVEDKGKRVHIVVSSDEECEKRVKSQSLQESQLADCIPEGFSSSGYAQAMYRTGAWDQLLAEVCCLRRVEHIAAIDKPQSDLYRPTYGLELRSEQSEPRIASQRDGDSCNSQNYDPSKSGSHSCRDERPNPAGTPSDPDDDQSESSSSSSLDSKSSNDEDKPWGNPNRQIMKLLANLKKENKKLKQKMKDQARSGYKAQTPKTYKGEEPNIKAYEQLLFKYNTWICKARLSRDESVKGICQFLDRKCHKQRKIELAGIEPA